MKKLSIILPTYNIEKYIETTVASVLQQTYRNIELIIVDDCSSDRTREILTTYAESDKRIKLIFNKQNIGPGAARNLGISQASGEYITFMDHDDWQDLNRYENMINIIERDKTDFVISYASDFFENSKKTERMRYPQNLPDIVQLDGNRHLFYRHFVPPWCKIHRTKMIKESNIRFAKNGVKFDDVLFHSLLLFTAKSFSVYKAYSYTHRFFDKSITAKFNNDRKLLNRERIECYRQSITRETSIKKSTLAKLFFSQTKLKRLQIEDILFMIKSSPLTFFKVYAILAPINFLTRPFKKKKSYEDISVKS